MGIHGCGCDGSYSSHKIDALKGHKPMSEKEKHLADIVIEWLQTNGYDGLYNGDIECACLIDDIMPCDGPGVWCSPGVKKPPSEFWKGEGADWMACPKER